MKNHFASVVAIVALVAACPVQSRASPETASLSQVSGAVFVNGKRYTGKPLANGDVVTAAGTGTAVLAYPDGCQVSASAGAPLTVGAASPCSVGNQATPGVNGTYLALGGLTAVGVAVGLYASHSVSP